MTDYKSVVKKKKIITIKTKLEKIETIYTKNDVANELGACKI